MVGNVERDLLFNLSFKCIVLPMQQQQKLKNRAIEILYIQWNPKFDSLEQFQV